MELLVCIEFFKDKTFKILHIGTYEECCKFQLCNDNVFLLKTNDRINLPEILL